MFGFSQGCLMTVEAGARYPHRFAGLVGISGHMFEPERLVKELSPVALQQRFLITHGFQDPIIPFAMTREQINILKGAGLNISWHEFMKAHTIAGEAEVAIIRDFITAGIDRTSNLQFQIHSAAARRVVRRARLRNRSMAAEDRLPPQSGRIIRGFASGLR